MSPLDSSSKHVAFPFPISIFPRHHHDCPSSPNHSPSLEAINTTAMPDYKFFYKILESAPPTPLPETLPTTDLDAKDGFIHLSTAQQTPLTANLFFSKFDKLWILMLRVKDLDGEVRFSEDLPGCPHVHDSSKGLGKGNVESVIVVEKGDHGEWTKVPELMQLED